MVVILHKTTHTHTQTRNLRFWSGQSCHCNLFTALLTLQFFTLWSLTTECLILECLSLVRKQVAYREAHLKSIFRTMDHPCTATYHYTREFKPFMEMRCVRPLPSLPAGLKCGEQLEVWTAKPLLPFQNWIQNFTFLYNLNWIMARQPVYLLIFLMP